MALQQIAKTSNDDLMADDEHALAPIVARQRVYDAAQSQDNVAPAFAARRTKVKLTEHAVEFRLFRILFPDTNFRQTSRMPNSFSRRRSQRRTTHHCINTGSSQRKLSRPARAQDGDVSTTPGFSSGVIFPNQSPSALPDARRAFESARPRRASLSLSSACLLLPPHLAPHYRRSRRVALSR